MLDQNTKLWILVIVSLLAVVVLCFVGRIPQDLAYHQFADFRQFGGINNFSNVLSNLPFLLIGLLGLWRYPRLAERESKAGYWVLCMGVVLVGFGSAAYHYAPSNTSLLWDRLPMTVAFMALLSLLLSERVIGNYKNATLWLLVACGMVAALYWSWTELQGRGDLRPYVLVQFLPILLMPLILLLFPARYLRGSLLFVAFVLYFSAKVCEHFDYEIFTMTRCVSGHTLKHAVAALAVLCIICAVPTRGANN
ncbi:MAG: ceramidase domain-containing protein [Steroidobacteraceae bacterium]